MKSAKVFMSGMYLQLLLGIALVLWRFADKSRDELAFVLIICYAVIVLVVLAAGWVSVAMAVAIYKRKEHEKLRSGWRLLKYGTIPFFIFNFIYSFFVCFVLLVASRGFLIWLVPIPIAVTCTMIFQSGCWGWCYILYLNSLTESGDKISKLHYVMQVIAILDIISTMIIGRKDTDLQLKLNDN